MARKHFRSLMGGHECLGFDHESCSFAARDRVIVHLLTTLRYQ